MIKCTILIPTTYNNGSPVSHQLLANFRRRLADIFGGYTDAGLVKGAWRSGVNCPMVVERNIELWVICDDRKLVELRQFAALMADNLDQESVYLEWHETNVEFIQP